MWRMVPVLVAEMGKAFSELLRAEALITEILQLEETSFRRTLERGLRLLEEATARLSAGGALPGEIAFRLYDTFGFPLDLTQDALRARGMTVDKAGFEIAMARQRAAARAALEGLGRAGGGADLVRPARDAGGDRVPGLRHRPRPRARCGRWWSAASRSSAPSPAAGHGRRQPDAVLRRIGRPDRRSRHDPRRAGRGHRHRHAKAAGGDLYVHVGRLEGGPLQVGDAVELAIDAARRERMRRAHSATHLLHAALRRHLGKHVTQKGSLVAPDRLRFDFSHPKPVTPDEQAAIEAEVNALSAPERRGDDPPHGPRRGDRRRRDGAVRREVRRRGPGRAHGPRARRPDYSVELCGGTHVRRTGDIALFEITSESAVAAGIRRIEALTGEAAYRRVKDAERAARRGGGCAQGRPRPAARTRRRAARGAQASRAGDRQAPPRARDRRRRRASRPRRSAGVRFFAPARSRACRPRSCAAWPTRSEQGWARRGRAGQPR